MKSSRKPWMNSIIELTVLSLLESLSTSKLDQATLPVLVYRGVLLKQCAYLSWPWKGRKGFGKRLRNQLSSLSSIDSLPTPIAQLLDKISYTTANTPGSIG